jgi:hypothetical protein
MRLVANRWLPLPDGCVGERSSEVAALSAQTGQARAVARASSIRHHDSHCDYPGFQQLDRTSVVRQW